MVRESGTEGAEDDEGEGVAEDEFEDPSEGHEHASLELDQYFGLSVGIGTQRAYDEVIGSYTRNAGFTCASPSHQFACQRTQA